MLLHRSWNSELACGRRQLIQTFNEKDIVCMIPFELCILKFRLCMLSDLNSHDLS